MKLKNKLALITGASRGIGQATAKRFAAEGAELILVSRKSSGLEKTHDLILEQTPDAKVTLAPADLEKDVQIKELCGLIAQRFGKLDILVGNAGVLGGLGPIAQQPEEQWQQVMQINLNANWLLLKCLDPLLQKSAAGRALFVTSGVTHSCPAYWGAYNVSKMALEAMVKTYANEQTLTNVRANLIDPGATRTDMRAQAIPGEDPENLPHPDDIMDTFVELAEDDVSFNGDRLQTYG